MSTRTVINVDRSPSAASNVIPATDIGPADPSNTISSARPDGPLRAIVTDCTAPR